MSISSVSSVHQLVHILRAQRQDADALNGRKSGAQQAVDAAQDKVCVLEVEQHPQAGCKGDQQQHLAHAGLCVKRFQPQAAERMVSDVSVMVC